MSVRLSEDQRALRDAVRELERTAPAGGAIQLAMVNMPSLRFALGRN